MATTPSDIGRTIHRPEPTCAMMGGAIPANRLKVKAAELVRAAQERGCSQRPAHPLAAWSRRMPRRVPALRDARPRLHRHQRIQENLAWPTLQPFLENPCLLIQRLRGRDRSLYIA